jgi:AraC-like DNA-binding protein
MSDTLILEVLMRGAAAGGFLGLAIAVLRGGPAPARITAALFCLGAAAHTLTQLPNIRAALGWAEAPVWAFSAMGAGLFWAFAAELFEDHERLLLRQFSPAAVLLAVSIAAMEAPKELARYLMLAHNVFGAVLLIHVAFMIASGWKSDLVEPRRRLRGPVLAAGVAYALAITAVESGEIFWRSALALSPVAAVLLLAISLTAIFAFLRAEPELFGSSQEAVLPDERGPTSVLDREDAGHAAALDRFMREERLYRDADLTIGKLALKLRLPEHRLRRLINQRLGHRNFNTFVNQWRLQDAKEALSDPAQVLVPISTIALDAGFQSLGPFNRAFKAETGVTPTEFRAKAHLPLTSGRLGTAASTD